MAEFVPTEQLQQSVAEGDVALTKQVVQAILNNNVYPDETARQAFEWAAERLPEMVQIHDPEDTPLEKDRDKWTADYYFDQKVVLRPNFSRERFMHLVDVRDHLRAKGHPDFQRQRSEASQSRPESDVPQRTRRTGTAQQKTHRTSSRFPKSGPKRSGRSKRRSPGCVAILIGVVTALTTVGVAIAKRLSGR